MLRAVRGFDVVAPPESPLLFNAFSGSVQKGAIPGRDGNGLGLFIFNSAFGQVNFTQTFDEQQTWGVHLDYAALVAGQAPVYSPQKFLQLATAAGLMVYLQQRTDGKIDVRSGSGALIITSSQSVAPVSSSSTPQYTGIELKCVFGPSGSVALHFDGVQVAQAPFNFGPRPYPDRVTIHQDGFGPPGFGVDNFVIWDGQAGDRFSTFTGRLRVQTLLPIADATSGWTPNSGANRFDRVNESTGTAPDGDTTYITPTATGPDQLFTLQSPTCFGAIYAVAVSVCAKPTSGSPTLDILFVGQSGAHVIGSVRPLFVGQIANVPASTKDYRVYQTITAQSPETADTWTDAEIQNAEWGVGASATPTLRVTQFYLEKVVSLVPQQFDCGGGSYSF